jgi:predicted  nucleic acid-binding Zn-ribbon protein
MRKNIIELIKLQNVSKEIYELEKILNSVPPEVTQLKLEVKNKKDLLNQMKTEIEKRDITIQTNKRQIPNMSKKLNNQRKRKIHKHTTRIRKIRRKQNYLKEHIKVVKKK